LVREIQIRKKISQISNEFILFTVLPLIYITVPEFIDPVSAQTSPKLTISMTENERFGLLLAKTGSKNSGAGLAFPWTKELSFVHEPSPWSLPPGRR
jgi:hypothetical protein